MKSMAQKGKSKMIQIEFLKVTTQHNTNRNAKYDKYNIHPGTFPRTRYFGPFVDGIGLVFDLDEDGVDVSDSCNIHTPNCKRMIS